MEVMISITEQLEIIREVRKRFCEIIDKKINTGLCLLLSSSIFKRGYRNYDRTDIRKYLPEFTYENAAKHCGAIEIGQEDPYDYYWWEEEDFESRLKFLDWLEEDLLK